MAHREISHKLLAIYFMTTLKIVEDVAKIAEHFLKTFKTSKHHCKAILSFRIIFWACLP